MADQQPDTSNKLVTGGLAGAIVIVLAWALKQWTSVDMPDYVEMALSTIISLAVAHLTPPNKPAPPTNDGG